MRKIKRTPESLQPNECIYLATEKEVKQILILFEYAAKIKHIDYVGYFFSINGRWTQITEDKMPDQKVLPASDFLPKKKKGFKKDLANLDSRIAKLEKLMQADTPVQAEPEFVLPEKWCVKRDSENYAVVNKFFNERADQNIFTNKSNAYIYPGGYDAVRNVPKGYTEITFDQFKKYVVEKQPEPAAQETFEEVTDWNIPQLVVDPDDGYTILTTGKHSNKYFYGMVLQSSPFRTREKGDYSKCFPKNQFKKRTTPVTINP